jgi:hypothetical protein
MLGRPAAHSVTLSVLSTIPGQACAEYGVEHGTEDHSTEQFALPAATPVEVRLDGLQPDTRYTYRLRWRAEGETAFTDGGGHSFHTGRPPGSAFTFALQGDSHPERKQQFDPALYAQTLSAVAGQRPDFYLTIGDDFSVDTLRTVTREAVESIYLNQRRLLGLVGCTAPVFLVNGNHEQAARYNLDGTADNMAVWAQNCRNRYFPQPAPDDFYTGDLEPVEHIGLLRDYYAWTWGDALFVVIDPYWHSPQPVDNVHGSREKGARDLWDATLGDEQYRWLAQTLEQSRAAYTFVFAHHVLGTGRGGIETAGLYEWGGHDRRGADLFAIKRPTWPMPIHQLMARNGVTIFFQGHDHLFAHQVLDGVVYQTLPQPADPNYALNNVQAYRSGETRPNSGYVSVSVGSERVKVEYVREYLPEDEAGDRRSGEVAFSYTVPANDL